MTTGWWRTSRLAAYVSATTLAGLSLLGVVVARDVPPFGPYATLWVLSSFVVVAEMFPIRISRRGEQDEVNTGSAFSFAVLLAFGIPAAVVAQSVASIAADLRQRKPAWKAAFNAGQYTISLAAAGWILSAFGRPPDFTGHGAASPGVAGLSGRDLTAVAAAAAAFFLLNQAVTTAALSLSRGERIWPNLRGDLARHAQTEAMLLAVAPIIVIASERSLYFVPIFVLPLLAAHRSARSSLDIAQREERFRSLVQNAADVIWILTPDGQIVYQSPSVGQILGIPLQHTSSHGPLQLMAPQDADQTRRLLETLVGDATTRVRSEFRIRATDGSWRVFEALWSNLCEDPSVEGIVVNARDITERKSLQDQLTHQAFHDGLTGLANRALLEDRAARALLRCGAVEGSAGVLYVDLDDFKTINDSLGHSAGDEVLIEAAKRISRCVRPADTVARVGGDEFAVLLEDETSVRACRVVAQRIIDALAEPLVLRDRVLTFGGSIGIAISGVGSSGVEELMRNADLAMYRAKAGGRGQYAIFEPSMHTVVLEQLELTSGLRGAAAAGELLLHYQPIVSLRGGEMVGCEALLRWVHPRRGVLAPAQFISTAEETGTILAVGRWVLESALGQAGDWRRANPESAPLHIAVNLSPRQVQDPRLVPEIAGALRESGTEPQYLTLEITESVMMDDVESTIGRLFALKDLGIRLAVDDFGIGYSSLAYLRRLPLDMIKIDKSFTRDMCRTASDEELVLAIVRLARTLGLLTVAEGIETAPQLTALREMGCDQGQGYLIARPMAPDLVAEHIRAQPGRVATLDAIIPVPEAGARPTATGAIQ